MFFRVTPTWDTEPNSGFEQHKDRLPFPPRPPGGEGWGEGVNPTDTPQNLEPPPSRISINKHHAVSAFKLHEPLRHTAYNTLRRYLRVRQNPPAYAAMGRDISFACHCKSVIGFGSPLRYRRMAPPYAVFLRLRFIWWTCVGLIHERRVSVSTGLPTRAWPPPSFGSESDGSG